MQRILVLSELYFPEQTSTGYLLTKIAECLGTEYNVKVITGPPTNFFQKISCPNYEVINQVEIFRCNGTNFKKDTIWGRFANLFTRSAAILWKGLFICQSKDILLVVTNPPLLPFIAILLKYVKGCKFVLLIHDVYPEVLVAAGICKPSSFIVKIGQAMNRFLYGRASRIITLGRDMTALAEAKLSKDAEKIRCIPNWADNEIVRPISKARNKLLEELGLTDKFVCLYAGNMGRTHGIEYLAETAKNTQLKQPEIHFLVIGSGSKKKWLEDYISRENISNITIIPISVRPRSEQIVSLTACDVAIILFVPGMAGVSVPSRMYNHMAAGKPIIAMADECSELAQVIKEENIGWIVSPGDIEGLIRTIELAATHPDLCVQMGSRAAVVAQTKYTFDRAGEAYKQLFREL